MLINTKYMSDSWRGVIIKKFRGNGKKEKDHKKKTFVFFNFEFFGFRFRVLAKFRSSLVPSKSSIPKKKKSGTLIIFKIKIFFVPLPPQKPSLHFSHSTRLTFCWFQTKNAAHKSRNSNRAAQVIAKPKNGTTSGDQCAFTATASARDSAQIIGVACAPMETVLRDPVHGKARQVGQGNQNGAGIA